MSWTAATPLSPATRACGSTAGLAAPFLESISTAPTCTNDPQPARAPAARKSQFTYRTPPGFIIFSKVIGIDWKSLETAVIHRASWHLPLVARPIVASPETIPNRRLQPACLGLRRQIPQSGRRRRFRLQPASPNPPPAWRQPETSLETSLTAPARTSDLRPSPAPAARKSQTVYRKRPGVIILLKVIGIDWKSLETAEIHQTLWCLPLVAPCME